MSARLENTRIAIRERNYADVLDLSLRVARTYVVPLGGALLAGALPAACFNAWLLADWAYPPEEYEFPATYFWYMLLLVLWEAPLVTAPLTLYLGQALFTERPQSGRVAFFFWKSLPQLILYQVVLRGLLLLLVVTWLVLFAAWPYLNEVILLERNPFFPRRQARMTTYRRTLALHQGSFGELLVRWFVAMGVGMLLFFSAWLSIWACAGMLLDEWWRETEMFTIYYPVALWLVFGFFAVVRFLGYLDLRIRREGWEVELMMRAEQARLTRQLA
jgi:hypothetical protein